MAEILRSAASESGPSKQLSYDYVVEVRDIQVTCTVSNDLKVAAEVKLGEGSEWKISYPDATLKLAVDVFSIDVLPQLSVRLRDDLNVSGRRTVVPGAKVKLSNGFGDFGRQARKHLKDEEIAAGEESRLRKQRQKEIDQKLGSEVTQAVLEKQERIMALFYYCMWLVIAAMISSTVVFFEFEVTELEGLCLALGLLVLWACASCGVAALYISGGADDASELQSSVRHTRPELQRYEAKGVSGLDWRYKTFIGCACGAPLVTLSCVVAMTVAFDLLGSGHLSGVVWGPVAVMTCCGAVCGWRLQDGGWRKKAGNALVAAGCFTFIWPVILLEKCGFLRGLADVLLKPPKTVLDAAVHTTQERTIVFKGNVLPKRQTVCSWPGKYETAWAELVAGSRKDNISAAVVFLPEGSEHFGFHDAIPARKDLRDLRGGCWCTPLYGEQKPWGCRWWSKWIANIEKAVSKKCPLVVFYFNGMRGQGKVKDFTTAGEEHARREAICRGKDAFLQSDSFSNALKAGLGLLSKKPGPDSSSPYSREVHRLFLATLSEEDRRFLEASEGLGNSQKAEVAWLERKGYQFIEKEVIELPSSSPKAIGRANE